MNQLFLEKLLENKHLFDSLLEIDRRAMNFSYSADQVIAFIESLLLLEEKPIDVLPNSLVLSTGEPFEILKFLSRVNPNTNFILFPNYSFMGINSMFVKIFNLVYGNICYLTREKNYNCYLGIKDTFNSIYILGLEIVYQEMKQDFPNALWILE